MNRSIICVYLLVLRSPSLVHTTGSSITTSTLTNGSLGVSQVCCDRTVLACVVAALCEVRTYMHVYNLPFPFQLVESEMGSTTTTLVNSVNSDIHGENLVDGEDGFNLGDSVTSQQVRDTPTYQSHTPTSQSHTPTSQSHTPELLSYQSWRLYTV